MFQLLNAAHLSLLVGLQIKIFPGEVLFLHVCLVELTFCNGVRPWLRA
jgi:hypothetical protein